MDTDFIDPEQVTDTPEGPEGADILRRACDQCRARKVRCNKEIPCSNCRSTNRECSSTGTAPRPPREPRHRVLISQQYERKIDHFGSRLVGIEELLRNLTTSLSRANSSAPPSVSTTTRTHTPPSLTESSTPYESSQRDDGTHRAFEGSSSMTAHTAFASDFVEQALTSTPHDRHLDPNIQNALESLRQMVRTHKRGVPHESRFAYQRLMPRGGVSQLPLPPTDVVLRLLREIKATPSMTFMMSCAFITVDSFIESCRKVFFATEDYSIDTFIVVNAGLYYLFQEKSTVDDTRSQEFLKYHYICRDNLETALSNLPLFLSPKREMLEALLLGVTYSIEISKFSLAWQLNSAAAAMCQTLGWHRLQASDMEENDTKPSIFWFCYMLDKLFSLRFGRNSVIQDWDISMPRRFGNTTLPGPWSHVLNAWIETGILLGEIYQHLYSPSALTRHPEERIGTARLLVDKMKQLWQSVESSSKALKEGSEAMVEGDNTAEKDKEWRTMNLDMLLKSGQVGHWASLTLIYRAIPSAPGYPSTFNAECIEAARMAFRCHEECMTLTSGSVLAQVGYLNWSILYPPFTPLIVLFCHIVETQNGEDLQRLAQFAASLQPVVSISQAVERLHRLSTILHQIAALYIETKANQEQSRDMGMAGNDFDMYLTQLGFISPQHSTEGTTATGPLDSSADPMADHTARLGDWFSGNRHVMGLMEEDLWTFDPGSWSSTMGT